MNSPSQPPESRAGRFVWVWALIWLFYLTQPLDAAWHLPGLAARVTALAAIVAFAALFIATFAIRRSARRRSATIPTRLAVAFVALAIVLVSGVAVLIGHDTLAMFVYVAVMAVFLLPGRWGPTVVVAIILGTFATERLIRGWASDGSVQFQIFAGALAMWGVMQLILRNSQLAQAREEITRLAVEQERNRLARDMHDILGHSLTVVSIKAELASRLIHLDPARAQIEMDEVQALSRQALADVRRTASGYRDLTLSGELANARTALAAAGIEAELPAAADGVPDDRRELFGWVVREGVTNVVRHSGATRCRIRMTPSTVEISDDGRGPAAGSVGGSPAGSVDGSASGSVGGSVGGSAPGLAAGPVGGLGAGSVAATRSANGGTGLVGLRERVEAHGGALSIGRSAENGYLLRVCV